MRISTLSTKIQCCWISLGCFCGNYDRPRTAFLVENDCKEQEKKGVEALLRSVQNANGSSSTFSPKCCFHLDGENAGILGSEAK